MTRRTKAIFEASIGLFLVFGYLWLIFPLYHTWIKVSCAIPILLLLIWTKYSNKESFRDLGFRLDNWRYSAKFLAIFTVISIPIIYVIWSLFFPVNNYFLNAKFCLRIFTYTLAALLQEYLFLAFFFRRYRNIFTPNVGVAVFLSALTFALIHIPDPPLMILCFIGGIAWAYVYSKSPNMYIIAISHGIFGLFGSYVMLVYFQVGPCADIGNWSKKAGFEGYIYVNNKYVRDIRKLVILGNQCDSFQVRGGIDTSGKEGYFKVKKIYTVFNGKDYTTTPCDSSPFRVSIPLNNTESGYYKLQLKILTETKYYSYISRKVYWIHILPYRYYPLTESLNKVLSEIFEKKSKKKPLIITNINTLFSSNDFIDMNRVLNWSAQKYFPSALQTLNNQNEVFILIKDGGEKFDNVIKKQNLVKDLKVLIKNEDNGNITTLYRYINNSN